MCVYRCLVKKIVLCHWHVRFGVVLCVFVGPSGGEGGRNWTGLLDTVDFFWSDSLTAVSVMIAERTGLID